MKTQDIEIIIWRRVLQILFFGVWRALSQKNGYDVYANKRRWGLYLRCGCSGTTTLHCSSFERPWLDWYIGRKDIFWWRCIYDKKTTFSFVLDASCKRRICQRWKVNSGGSILGTSDQLDGHHARPPVAGRQAIWCDSCIRRSVLLTLNLMFSLTLFVWSIDHTVKLGQTKWSPLCCGMPLLWEAAWYLFDNWSGNDSLRWSHDQRSGDRFAYRLPDGCDDPKCDRWWRRWAGFQIRRATGSHHKAQHNCTFGNWREYRHCQGIKGRRGCHVLDWYQSWAWWAKN